MEVLRSTHFEFNDKKDGGGGGESLQGGGKGKPYKGSRSPMDNKPSRLSKLSPVKGYALDSPFTKGSTSDYESMKPEDSTPMKFATGISNTPMSMKKRISPADSGIEMTPISLSPQRMNPKLRTMYNGSRRDADESTDFSINPDPVPYQASNFMAERFSRLDVPHIHSPVMSSTMMKKVPVSRRHLDTFGADLVQSLGKRGVFLHTDRYQWDLAAALDGLSQRERLQAELEYMEKLRGIKRRREVLPHRARLDLLMGGKKVEFSERFDIQREIQKLRSLILPEHAKDLYHGRGFTLPTTHNSVKPRRTLPYDIDLEEDLGSPFSPDKYSYNPETGRVQPKWQKSSTGSPSTLPKINNRGYLLGAPQPAHLTRSKTNVTSRDAKHATGGRSVTAYPSKKDTHGRPAATAPTVGPTAISQQFGKAVPVKIPVSARDPDETDTNADPSSAAAASGAPLSAKKPEVEEILKQPDISQDQEDEGRAQPSGMSTARNAAPTPNPLKVGELPVTEEEQDRLKQTFNKLDTDKDGHIKFSQLQTQLPKQFSQSQEKYIKQVYDITSSSTFFGVDEFMTMSYLTKVVTNLRGEALEAYSKLDFTALHETIIKYLDLYQSVDRGQRGKITLDSLQNILCTALPIDLKANEQKWNNLVDNLSLDDPGLVSKMEFIAHIPYFLCIRDKK